MAKGGCCCLKTLMIVLVVVDKRCKAYNARHSFSFGSLNSVQQCDGDVVKLLLKLLKALVTVVHTQLVILSNYYQLKVVFSLYMPAKSAKKSRPQFYVHLKVIAQCC